MENLFEGKISKNDEIIEPNEELKDGSMYKFIDTFKPVAEDYAKTKMKELMKQIESYGEKSKEKAKEIINENSDDGKLEDNQLFDVIEELEEEVDYQKEISGKNEEEIEKIKEERICKCVAKDMKINPDYLLPEESEEKINEATDLLAKYKDGNLLEKYKEGALPKENLKQLLKMEMMATIFDLKPIMDKMKIIAEEEELTTLHKRMENKEYLKLWYVVKMELTASALHLIESHRKDIRNLRESGIEVEEYEDIHSGTDRALREFLRLQKVKPEGKMFE
jgi:hypothetical protein